METGVIDVSTSADCTLVAAPLPSADPADPADLAFRSEVAQLRSSERRRLFPLGLHVGSHRGPVRRLTVPWPAPADLDHGLRFDLADALVDALVDDRVDSWPAGEETWAWVTRPGVPEIHDCDLAWSSAVSRALAAHRLPMAGFRAVTRTGWLDVLTGEHRTWKRLRR